MKSATLQASYSTVIQVNAPNYAAFKAITQVNQWWATNVLGSTNAMNDVFTVRFGKTFSTICITEFIDGEKMKWTIQNSSLPLFKDEKVWNGTHILWELKSKGSMTEVRMTHLGLTPDKECYKDCYNGWNYYVTQSLKELIATGKGMPGTGIFARITDGDSDYGGLLYFKNDPLPDCQANSLFIDVKETKGEQVTKIHGAGVYQKETFDPHLLKGDYFMTIESPTLRVMQSLLRSITTSINKNNILMKDKSYKAIIHVKANPHDAMKTITKVDGWWAKHFEGKAVELNDRFSVHFGDTFVDFKISELIPDKKVVWKVMDCNLHWIKAKKEWKGTEVVFQLSEEKTGTQIDFTHVGLVPGVECYKDCEVGWNGHVTDSLVKFINEGKGKPE